VQEKPADVAEILAANKVKLIRFLQEFQNEKGAGVRNEWWRHTQCRALGAGSWARLTVHPPLSLRPRSRR